MRHPARAACARGGCPVQAAAAAAAASSAQQGRALARLGVNKWMLVSNLKYNVQSTDIQRLQTSAEGQAV
jgi:hypothetical protein